MYTSTNGTRTAAVDMRHVAKTFRPRRQDEIQALDRLDLSIGQGEVVALLGPNGAGKTTTLDLLLGLTDPTEGAVEVFGLPPRRAVADGRVSAVLQTGGLLRDLTVRETVQMIASTFDTHSDVDEVLERARITDISRRMVSKCSGGQQQRLRFALALLPDPDLLVLDEPTAGMDVTSRREFWAAMRTEAEIGRTVVFATHYLEEADSFADRIVMIAGGRTIADGSAAEIRARATGRTVTADVGPDDEQRLKTVLTSIPGRVDVSVDQGRIVVRSTDSDEVARRLLAAGARDLEITSGSLEAAFLTITEGAAA